MYLPAGHGIRSKCHRDCMKIPLTLVSRVLGLGGRIFCIGIWVMAFCRWHFVLRWEVTSPVNLIGFAVSCSSEGKTKGGQYIGLAIADSIS